MVEKKVQKTKVPSDYLSDSDTPDKEVDPQLRMSEDDKRIRKGYIGSVIAYKSAGQSYGGKRSTEVT